MEAFLEDFRHDVQRRTEDYLSSEGLMPALMPRIDLEVTAETREMAPDIVEGNPYEDSLEEIKDTDVEELLDEVEEQEFNNPDDNRDEVSRKGSFSEKTAETSADISVNLTPFDLLPFTSTDAREMYKAWADQRLEKPPEKVLERLGGKVELSRGKNPAETVFNTVQRRAELANNLSVLQEPVNEVYQQILASMKQEAVATGVHEGAHARFEECYEFGIPELSEAETDLVIEEVQDKRQGYGFVDDAVHNHWEDAIERIAGEEPANQYREFLKMNGVNEVYARIVEKSYEQEKISDLKRDDLYEEGSFWGEANYEAQNPFGKEGGTPAKVSGVEVEEMRDYVMDNGLDSILEMSKERVLDRFYDESAEEAI